MKPLGRRFWHFVVPCLAVVPFTILPTFAAFSSQAQIIAPDPVILGRAVLLSAGFFILVFLLLIRIGHSPQVVSAALAVGMAFFGLYPVARQLLGDIALDWAYLLGAGYLFACAILAGIILARRPKAASALYPIVNTLALVLALLMLVQFARVYGPWGETPLVANELDQDELKGIATSQRSSPLPDVYHIILDGFGRPDVLKRMYGLDLSGVVQALSDQGFEVAIERGSANYPQTYLSLASMLNIRYLQRLTDQIPDEMSRAPMHELIQRSSIVQAFKRLGYEIFVVGSIYSATQTHRLADVCECDYPLFGHFESILIHLTPLADIGLLGLDHRSHRSKIERSLATLESLRPSLKPRFLLAHIMAPHPPFVFDAQGRAIDPARAFAFADGDTYRGTREEYVQGYRDQAQYLASRMLPVLQHLQQVSRQQGREAVIIVHGDHGPRSRFDTNEAANTDPSESLPVFLAIRWSTGGRTSNVPVASLVNVYREFFRRYFTADLPLLPDRGFVSSLLVPYRFIEAELH